MDLGGDDGGAPEPPASRLRAPGFARQQQARGGGARTHSYAQQLPARAPHEDDENDGGGGAGVGGGGRARAAPPLDANEAEKLSHARELVLRHRREERERERRREAAQAAQSEGFEGELAALESIRAQKLAQAEEEKRAVSGRAGARCAAPRRAAPGRRPRGRRASPWARGRSHPRSRHRSPFARCLLCSPLPLNSLSNLPSLCLAARS